MTLALEFNLATIDPPPLAHESPSPVVPTLPHDPTLLDALIISDIHLGSDNCQAKAVARLLESLLEGDIRAARLIINGDVFDSIDFRRLKKTHWKVLSLIRHLSDKLEVIWIAGNHDGSADIVSQLLGVTVVEEYILHSGDQRILCIHGHRFDDFLDDHPVLTVIGDAIYWILQRLDRTHRVARMAKKKSKVFVHCVDKIEAGAMRLAREQHCDAVLCGHTHVPVSKPARSPDGVSYYNSGCWTETPSTYLTVAHGTITLHSTATGEPARLSCTAIKN